MALTLLVAACGDGDSSESTASPPSAPSTTRPTDLAAAPPPTKAAWAPGAEVAVYPERGAPSPSALLESPNPAGAPLVFGVLEDHGRWLRVQLPTRPNHAEGWLRTADVQVTESDFAVKVDLSDRWITVTQDGVLVREEPVAIGAPETPTPLGRFFFVELHGPLDAGSPYGSYAFGVSAFSDVLMEFNGGPGQIAVHGNGQPSTVGQAVSNGCIRLPDSSIAWMAETVPVGTPVEFVE